MRRPGASDFPLHPAFQHLEHHNHHHHHHYRQHLHHHPHGHFHDSDDSGDSDDADADELEQRFGFPTHHAVAGRGDAGFDDDELAAAIAASLADAESASAPVRVQAAVSSVDFLDEVLEDTMASPSTRQELRLAFLRANPVQPEPEGDDVVVAKLKMPDGRCVQALHCIGRR
jgi:hypothetical protein